MNPMFNKKKSKKPSEYKTLRIRVPAEVEIEKLLQPLNEIRTHLNKTRSSEQKMWMKNHVLLMAIEKGLEHLTPKKKTRKRTYS